ncbi:hypothetical protein ACFPMF_16525 [Larkinella bovis]|uniref:Lipoprotein n=1 Tax=Larkinella bovis TaxID=683041 RepID=A0ABW0IEP4_9BACT
MKKIGIVFGMALLVSLGSCARRACPAYDSQLQPKQPAPVEQVA